MDENECNDIYKEEGVVNNMKKQMIKQAKGISRMIFYVGILCSIFGVIFILTIILTPISLVMVPFALLWTAIAIVKTVRAYKNGYT